MASIMVASAFGASASPADVPNPILYLPLDGNTTAAVAEGAAAPRFAGQRDDILTLVSLQRQRLLPGKVGQCYDVGDSPLVFRCAGNFRADEGACSFWLSPDFAGDNTNLYATFFGAADWGMLYKYLDQTTITFGTAKPERDLYYDCGSRSIESWAPGEWHHLVVCWSRQQNERRIYTDGELQARAPFPFSREVQDGPLFIGSGCTLYPGHVAHAKMDEVAIWDRPLENDAVRELYQLGTQGEPLLDVDEPPEAAQGAGSPALNVVRPQTPPAPSLEPAAPQRTKTRETTSLDGWWCFLPAQEPVADLPVEGWGLARVPGYWTSNDDAIGPDGQPPRGQWAGRPLSEFSVGYYQRSFRAEPEWERMNVFLHFGGVDGLAELFLNGQHLAWLPSWEQEAYDIGGLLRYGEENTLTVALHTRGDSSIGGIYDSVSLAILPRAFTEDLAIRPRVEKGQIELSCNVWHSGEEAEARLEFDVAEKASPDSRAKQFVHSCRLGKADRTEAALSSQVQRVECIFDWPDARPWTLDDPFLYQVQARLRIGDQVVDESPVFAFGFREFEVRGSDFYLNGKPVHLRGHQIDLGWGDQFDRVRELKAAGMNCFEFSGPIRSDWYAGIPYRLQLFEGILRYADETGLLALPILPGARVLQDRIFEPEVARLYQRRVEKHIRRYGNHPSVAMWYMHFNLAGYRWYIPPDKIDGSYKPTDPAFAAKERYCREAQRIAQSVDPRPIYHHACGNFGDIYTLNCYIGPTSPLQERSEWPSRWAEKRPFPLVACEHGLMLVPYWFRPRRFPLSEVYSDEPIFDELSAIYLGREAYADITPELFDLYDMGSQPRGSRTRALVRHHPGYQQVKSLFARESLRSWRTYGVSGIIFNAINWDFRDEEGNQLPVMRALARYFGDTDLYIAGPEGDWPSKDHSFYAGERIQKQIVLLNDLTHDIPCTLEWRLEDEAGKVHASGRVDATSRAGTPTFCPIEFRAPDVRDRDRFALTVEPVPRPAEHFRPETFALQVFPKQPQPVAVRGKILVYDTAGRTNRMLERVGMQARPLDGEADLSDASLVIVGRESYGDEFVALAKALNLESAVGNGLSLLVFEQTEGAPFGLRLQERSTRQVFPAAPDHEFFSGLAPEDFVSLRGESDLTEAYPEAPPETERQWPGRFFKWGNRGTVATFVYTKPHYAPFTPLLECGFDLVESPLMEARLGRGRIVFCQVDVTSRYGTDPVSTLLVHNLLSESPRTDGEATRARACLGQSAQAFLGPFGIVPGEFDPEESDLVFVGAEPLAAAQVGAVEAAAQRGAVVILLPNAASAEAFGLRLEERRLLIGGLTPDPLLAGLSAGDTYLKSWTSLSVAAPGDSWRCIVEPGLVSVKRVGQGSIVSCQLDPTALGQTRGRVKALRLWNVLLSNLRAHRQGFDRFLEPTAPLYEDNEWEEMPGYINW